MALTDWLSLAFAVLVLGGGAFLFWRGLSLRPHRPDQARPPEHNQGGG